MIYINILSLLLVNTTEIQVVSGTAPAEDNAVNSDIIDLDHANETYKENSDIQKVTENSTAINDEMIIYSNFDLRNPDVVSNKSEIELAREKIYLKKKCEFNSGEITVCAVPNKNEKYRIVNEKSLRELPRHHRSWGVLSERLHDNGLASTAANSHSAFVEKSLQAMRDSCEGGLEDARKQNETARAISKIAIKQTGSKPRRKKGLCEF